MVLKRGLRRPESYVCDGDGVVHKMEAAVARGPASIPATVACHPSEGGVRMRLANA